MLVTFEEVEFKNWCISRIIQIDLWIIRRLVVEFIQPELCDIRMINSWIDTELNPWGIRAWARGALDES